MDIVLLFKFIYGILGLLTGVGFMFFGLFFRAITPGHWVMRIGQFEMSNAIPALGFAFLGVVVIWITRFRVKSDLPKAKTRQSRKAKVKKDPKDGLSDLVSASSPFHGDPFELSVLH